MVTKIIKKRLDKKCLICGKKIKVIVYVDYSYRGGHYFGNIPINTEYWECPKCYKG